MGNPRRSLGSGISVCLALIIGLVAVPAHARIIALDIDLPLDQIASNKPYKIGDHHHARVFYDDAMVDPKTQRVRVLHFTAHVVHGKSIVIDADEHTRRVTIHPQDHPEVALISGQYQIDPRPISGPEVTAAAIPAAPGPMAAAPPQATSP
jgi:hypothetical protein